MKDEKTTMTLEELEKKIADRILEEKTEKENLLRDIKDLKNKIDELAHEQLEVIKTGNSEEYQRIRKEKEEFQGILEAAETRLKYLTFENEGALIDKKEYNELVQRLHEIFKEHKKIDDEYILEVADRLEEKAKATSELGNRINALIEVIQRELYNYNDCIKVNGKVINSEVNRVNSNELYWAEMHLSNKEYVKEIRRGVAR